MKLRFLVLGAGAIGTYLGVSLHASGHEVVFLEREADLEDLKRRGLEIRSGVKVSRILNPECYSDPKIIQERDFDLVILALKTYHLDDLLPDLVRYKDQLAPILCFQNGVESEKILAEALGKDLVIPGTVTSAVDRILKGQAGVSRLRGLGLGGNHPLVGDLMAIFREAGLNPRHYQRPEAMKWSKLVVNLLGNASSAILNMTTAQVYADPALFEVEREQIKEALRVMRLQKIPVVNLPGVPVKLLAVVFSYLPRLIAKPLAVKFIGGGRGHKMPSFHIDLHSGRGKSEVKDLNGAVVRAGIRLDCPTPVNLVLTEILTGLLEGREALEEFNRKPEALLARLEPHPRL